MAKKTTKKKSSKTSRKVRKTTKTTKKKKKTTTTKKKKKSVAPKKVKATKAQREEAEKLKKLRFDTKETSVSSKKTGVAGRPARLNEQIIDQISKLIMAGAYIETACAACGIARCLYYEWLKLGARRKDAPEDVKEMIDPIYEQFNDAIQEAVVKAEIRDVLRIDKAAERSWQAAAWKLERKFPNRWAKNLQVKHEGEINQKVEAKVEVSVHERKERVLKILDDRNALDAAFQVLEALDADRNEQDSKGDDDESVTE